MIKVRDKWFRFLAILIPFLFVSYTNSLWTGFTITRFLKCIVSLICIIVVVESVRYLCYNSRVWFPKRKVTRVAVLITIGLAWTTLVLATSTILRNYIGTGTWDFQMIMKTSIVLNDKNIRFGVFGYSFFNAITNFFFLMLSFDILYHYAKLRHSEMEKEKLEKEKLKAELQQLKGIINPHFLFNNLNSLSSLISDDPAKAEIFLDELTKVFRYLLRNNEVELTTLAQEMQFIESYYHLLQTRYGKAIRMDVEIDSINEQMMIPPLTLQLLVENAFKHNQLSAENPLSILIVTTGRGKLIVENSVSKRHGQVESTGIGLQNINARYAMLNQPGLKIEKSEDHFSVTIQLIEPDAAGVNSTSGKTKVKSEVISG